MIKSILGEKSKNLCDVAYLLTLPADKNFNGYGFWEVEISVEPNTAYTLSRENSDLINLGGVTYFGLANEYSNPSADNIHHKWLNHELIPSRCRKSVTLTSNSDGKLWIFFSVPVYKFWKKNLNPFGYIQLEKGSTATEYVPHELTSYKSIMKVSDVCQLVDKSKFTASGTTNGITWVSNGDGSITLNGTCTSGFALNPFNQQIPVDQTHFYYSSPYVSINYGGAIDGKYATGTIGYVKASAFPTKFNTVFYIWIGEGKSFSNVTTFINIDDLTEMFGAGNEPKTVAEFKAKFPNDYYPYSPSCFVTSFDERMPCKTKNLFDKSKADVISREYYFTPNQDAGSNFYVMNVKPGITYTVTYERFIESTDTGAPNALELSIQTGTHYKDGTQLVFILGNGKRGVWVKRSKQFTVPSGINQVTFTGLKDRFLYRNFMVQEGTTATDYVPYGYV